MICILDVAQINIGAVAHHYPLEQSQVILIKEPSEHCVRFALEHSINAHALLPSAISMPQRDAVILCKTHASIAIQFRYCRDHVWHALQRYVPSRFGRRQWCTRVYPPRLADGIFCLWHTRSQENLKEWIATAYQPSDWVTSMRALTAWSLRSARWRSSAARTCSSLRTIGSTYVGRVQRRQVILRA